ncbi:response regulator [Paenibacillus sp. UNC499MF]|uniref:response regulator transcription factor n=1 Tax=Paenibacillus sp. UNC499MF TaxID=1502751 RepID=UPI0008A05627|nr:response regulator [Paenibacillus sp. UNC499MF]SEG45055.1 two-component system, response regulator YesN [Paenibacillus sp. UNC499MF]
MYRLLIVDDIPIIVEGLKELFEETPQLSLEIHTAYSGEEALELLKNKRIDLVISDIKMPGLEGIGLLREIKTNWPGCKVIFLTGYNDFQYVQNAVKYGGFDYLLKIESDEKIIAAVTRAIGKLDEEKAREEMFERAEESMKRALPSLQKEYVSSLLQGKRPDAEQLDRHFREIGIPLGGKEPVLLLLGRVDVWREMVTPPDKALFVYAVQNIAEEILSPGARVYTYVYDQVKIAWFIQPGGSSCSGTDISRTDWEKTRHFTGNALETIQRACKNLLKLPVSFVVGKNPVSWADAADKFHELKYNFLFGAGLGNEIILTEPVPENHGETGQVQKRSEFFTAARVQLLGKCLENGHRCEFFNVYKEISDLWESEDWPFERKKEVYHSLSAVFLAYVNKNDELRAHLNSSHDLSILFHCEADLSVAELKAYFLQTAELIFDWNGEQAAHFPDELVHRVHTYIEDNLAKDISLNAIADHVGLNPSYLSRLYKQMTGIGLSDYINDYRNLKAKELLLGSPMRVGEIAALLGYNSALAFIRFFKKQNESTPQEYRSRRASGDNG